MRYELRSARDLGLVRSGTRRGFCLRDATTFPHYCGRRLPQPLALRMGVGPTKASRWAPVSEGQSFDITNVPTGRYWLVQRAHPGGRYRESDDSNNASSALIEIEQTRVGRAHHVKLRLIGACQGDERCDNPQAFAT